MAKAKPIDSLECDAKAAVAAAEVLKVRFAEMLEFHAAAVEPDGVDGVHDMRVASRRFRSALRDFARLFEKTTVKPLKKHVKVVANKLGDVRDQDVALEALGSLREKSPNERIAGGIDLLIESRRAQRSEAHAEFLKHVTVDRLTSLRDGLNETLEHTHLEAQTFRAFAFDAIQRALEKFLNRAEKIFEPFNDNALHKMRLSAKRLRYALELFDVCWKGELQPFAKYLSKLQSNLGAVHDSSEWIEYLGRRIRENDGLDSPTAAWLISEFVSLRTEEYLKALELWNEWLASNLTGRLHKTMEKVSLQE